MSHLICVEALASLIAAPVSGTPPVRLLDVRWRLDRPDGRPDYLAGHLPGAVFVDLDAELSRHGAAEEGRHPLSRHGDLQRAARRWGLNDGDAVVVYDDCRSLAAARAWWMLRRAGIDVRVLDGGLAAWTAAGGALEAGDVVAAEGSVRLADDQTGELGIDEAAAFPETGLLLDARAPERYRGETEPLDPIAGHIPGAVNLPMAELTEPDGRLRDAAHLREAFAAVGVAGDIPVAAYCGSGITAAHTALALAEAGIEASVFTGSWSQWSNTAGRAIARGATPAGDVRSR